MDVTALAEGPELDRLVAERVMDWQLKKDQEDCIRNQDGRPVGGWRPSAGIFEAWEVVERMRALNRFLRLDSTPDGWWAGFSANSLTPGETAPLAICRAALLAVART